MLAWLFGFANEKRWASFHVSWLLSAHEAPAKREMTRRRKEPHRDDETRKASSAYRTLIRPSEDALLSQLRRDQSSSDALERSLSLMTTQLKRKHQSSSSSHAPNFRRPETDGVAAPLGLHRKTHVCARRYPTVISCLL